MCQVNVIVRKLKVKYRVSQSTVLTQIQKVIDFKKIRLLSVAILVNQLLEYFTILRKRYAEFDSV